MPTIDISIEDLCKLTKRKLSLKAIEELLEYCKAGIESQEGDLIRVKLEDTNQPYLWSTEGLARLMRGILDAETGLPTYKLVETKDSIKVDKSIEGIRPCIAAFSAKGPAITDAFIKSLIQFQEKLCDGFGMKRKKVSIGIYRYAQINWPVSYKAVEPKSQRFTPLGMSKELNLLEILEVHETGRAFGWILEGMKKYPLLIDSKGQVLSFPPIINSNEVGKIEAGDTELLVEITGTDEESVNLTCNIMASAFADRGWTLRNLTIEGKKSHKTPTLATQKSKLDINHIESMIGMKLGKEKISSLLKKMRYGIEGNSVMIPCYRDDVMHSVDIAEDVIISYGYNQVPDQPLETYTLGSPKPSTRIIDACREALCGMGYQETLNAILCNKELLYTKMNHPDIGTVELKDYQTQRYSCLRSSILPLMIETLSLNKHNDYPQKIYETGEVAIRAGKQIIEKENLAFAHTQADATYADAQQALDAMMKSIGVKYSLRAAKNPAYVPGRCAEVLIGNESVGLIGEIHPETLSNFEIRMPTCGGELNMSALVRIKQNQMKNE